MKQLHRLIKRLTIFDWVAIVVTAILVAVLFFFFYRKSSMITIRVKVTDKDVLYARTTPQNWYADKFIVGDYELDALGRKITEITSVESFSVSSTDKAVYLNMKVKSLYDSRTKSYSVRGKKLVFGTPMKFELANVTFDGIVTDFPDMLDQNNIHFSYVVVEALARGLEPTVAKSIKNGDKIVDSNGVLLAEVLSAKQLPAERVTQTDRGDLLLRYDPLYLDLAVRVKVRTLFLNNDVYVFDNMPLKVGEVLPLNFSDVSVIPLVTKIDD